MPLSAVQFFTDFADQAVILPLIACVAIILWVSGWRRGAFVWCLGTGATLAFMAALKLGFRACGPELFGDNVQSPSGHTASAGAVYGSILAFLNARLGGREVSRALIVLGVVVLIGTSRVVLGDHTLSEALLGGIVGFVAAQAMLHFAGEPAEARFYALSLLPLLALPFLLHGIHLQAESELRSMAFDIWPFSLCR